MQNPHIPMGWLRLVGSLKLQVSFAGYSLFYRALLKKRPIILRSLLIVATPYMCRTYQSRHLRPQVSDLSPQVNPSELLRIEKPSKKEETLFKKGKEPFIFEALQPIELIGTDT